MRLRGETVGEITACARVMRREALKLEHPYEVIDVCGTGGDGAHTLNISTAAAFVAAGGGAQGRQARHARRLVPIGLRRRAGRAGRQYRRRPAEVQRRALDEAGHLLPVRAGAPRRPASRQPVRAELGFRTIFNLLGPLSNPAGARRQVLGVYDSRWIEPLARVLGALGADARLGRSRRRAGRTDHHRDQRRSPNGATGMCVSSPSRPKRWGCTTRGRGRPARRRSGGKRPRARARCSTARSGAYRDIVLLNTAAALLVADRVETLREGVALAAERDRQRRRQTSARPA